MNLSPGKPLELLLRGASAEAQRRVEQNLIFFFNDTATTEIYTLFPTRRSSDLIGESLLPMNLPVFERLGVLDKVRQLGVFKPGADFEAENERGYNTYAFARALGNSPPHAYQVWRQDFDKMLYDHARESGADAREGHEVRQIEQAGPRESWL